MLVSAIAAPAASDQGSPGPDWRTFEGTWTMSGQRQVLPAATGRPAGTFQLSGALALAVAR
jgi:hypothetical protein